MPHHGWQGPPHSALYGPPPWAARWGHRRRFVFWRFLFVFGFLSLLFLLAIAIVLALTLGPVRAAGVSPDVVALVACGIPLAILLLTSMVGGWVFRRIGTPMADIMAAADSVAGGDLSVRVRENTPGELGQLARSFNHMIAELERAEQQRRNLTADVAHELRTPLHIIQGNLEGILDGVYEPSRENITATLDETRLLTRLISDLQTLSLAEAGQLPLHKVLFSASDLLSDVATSFAAQSTDLQVNLRVETRGDADRLGLYADPDRMDQVISNLVANALRYTPAGGTVTLWAEPLPGGVRLGVEDTGEGIPTDDLPYIYDRFWRGDRSRTRSDGASSGLGLAIARQLVQANGGKIYVESLPGFGTRFTIEMDSAVH